MLKYLDLLAPSNSESKGLRAVLGSLCMKGKDVNNSQVENDYRFSQQQSLLIEGAQPHDGRFTPFSRHLH